MRGKLVRNNFIWYFIKPIAVFFYELVELRNKEKKRRIYKKKVAELADFFKNKEVLNGIFKGLKYPDMSSIGSALYPKLLGSYESELNDIIINLKVDKYDNIIDIGCAEGYYAIGFSMLNKHALIYAYDINQKALDLCLKMAHLNSVSDRVILKKKCEADELKQIVSKGKTLIISDCEGFESELFNDSNIIDFVSTDLIIETHDFIDIDISDKLEFLFSKTHSVTRVKSIDDFQKLKKYNYSELFQFNVDMKKEMIFENRPCIMDWLICISNVK